MNRCPKCSMYMSAYTQTIFGGIRTIYTCPCGYFTDKEITNIDNKIHNVAKGAVNETTEKTNKRTENDY